MWICSQISKLRAFLQHSAGLFCKYFWPLSLKGNWVERALGSGTSRLVTHTSTDMADGEIKNLRPWASCPWWFLMAAESSWGDAEVVQGEGVSELRKLVTGIPHLSEAAGKPTLPPPEREIHFPISISLGKIRDISRFVALKRLLAETLNLSRGRYYFYLSKALCCENILEPLLRRHAETPDSWRITFQ